MNFIYIWHDGRYRSQVLLSAIPTPGPDLEVTEFTYKNQNVHIKVYISGFQVGHTFPTIPIFPSFFVLLLFPAFFLKMPYYPFFFFVQKCLK